MSRGLILTETRGRSLPTEKSAILGKPKKRERLARALLKRPFTKNIEGLQATYSSLAMAFESKHGHLQLRGSSRSSMEEPFALAKVNLRSRELINRPVLPHKHLDGLRSVLFVHPMPDFATSTLSLSNVAVTAPYCLLFRTMWRTSAERSEAFHSRKAETHEGEMIPKRRIWLLTRRGARERSPYDFFFYGVGVRDQIRWLLPDITIY
ncbi:hypothetical protein L1987_61994 [Smallanthus sonchifolius]|uniref:Uncharacterized protein n=1 Tax=Smallanthus sonchifolius TaxID=185202 RepID=A0ACB9C960_9ASTR|nr:hypothetical protein L1987_61994 [Smallanthus sonchifolius]